MAETSEKRPGAPLLSPVIAIGAVGIALVTFIVYLPALGNGFVEWWDDQWYVTANPGIRTIDIEFFRWAFTSVIHSNWHPLTIFSYAIDYAIWGLDPFGYHLVNNILHAINTALVFILALRLTALSTGGETNRPATFELASAMVAALLFGLHPLHVESVAWVSERKDLLSTLFYLLAVMAYISPSLSNKKLPRLSATTGLFILALLSKPMAISLPVVLLLLDIYPLRAVDITSIKSVAKAVIKKTPFLILAVISAALTIWAQKKGLVPLEVYSLPERFALSIRAYGFYLYKMALPFGLAHFYPRPEKIEFFSSGYLAAYALFTILTAAALISVKRHKALTLAWFFYLITLIPVIGIVQVGSQAAADRYTYLPSIGIFLLAGAGTGRLAKKYDLKMRHIIIILAVIFAPISYLTIRQTGIWKDSLTLLTHEIELYPTFQAYANRAEAYSKAGLHEKAVFDYTKVIEMAAAEGRTEVVYKGYIGRGATQMGTGDAYKAIDDYMAAIEVIPDGFVAHNNLGNSYKAVKDYPNAVASYQKAAVLRPEAPEPYFNLAIAYIETGDDDKAVEYMNMAASLGSKEAAQYLMSR